MRSPERPTLSFRFPALLLAAFLAAGCGGVRYVSQAAAGQLSLACGARPIPKVIRDDKTPPRIRALLGEVAAIKAFGEASGLKPTQNYRDYVQLDRANVVYVVSASDPLRFKSKVWSFPIVGDFPYLGWFKLDEAKSFTRELETEGLDVDLRGATAYSTLGWFRDALLSSMIPEGDEALGQLVDVVLHESVHATVYVPSQAYFNESLASFVADRLTPVYLEKTRGPGSKEQGAFEQAEARAELWRKRLHESYLQLADLYASSRPDAEKREEKASLLRALKEELKAKRDLNNATLVQYRTYGVGTAEFSALYEACGGDWRRFLGALGTLGPKSFPRPQQEDLAPVVLPLVQAGCPAAPKP